MVYIYKDPTGLLPNNFTSSVFDHKTSTVRPTLFTSESLEHIHTKLYCTCILNTVCTSERLFYTLHLISYSLHSHNFYALNI